MPHALEREGSEPALNPTATIRSDQFDAVLFDLDGVVTRTARLHAAAWKATFDSYLRARSARLSEAFVPFDQQADYAAYVDGRPRADGVRGFLESRGIILPPGEPRDSPDKETIAGLAGQKNRLFLELVHKRGIETYPSTIELLKRLKGAGLKAAIVSSSRNCAAILDAAGLTALFDIRVDGCDADDCWLPGKPAPDIFLEAARRLDVEPERSIVIEDAVVGIDAAISGGFGLVIALARKDDSQVMRSHGADIVVPDLAALRLDGDHSGPVHGVPDAVAPEDLASLVANRLGSQHLALFLDYDGTLTPIGDRPEHALLAPAMRRTLEALSRRFTVGIITGRSREDIEQLMDIPNLYYAGSHGFDISGPGKTRLHHEEGSRFVPVIRQAAHELTNALQGIPGALVEDKKYAVAVHFRLVSQSDHQVVREAVNHVLTLHPELHRTVGKKVFELLPRIDWDKGKAVSWLLEAMELDPAAVLPIYIGDDTTDEDAFGAISDQGIGVLVAERPRPTRAHYRLQDTEAVMRFFEHFLRLA